MRHVLPERGNHMHFAPRPANRLIEHFGNPPSAGVHPRDIRRQQQHTFRLRTKSAFDFRKRLLHQRFHAAQAVIFDDSVIQGIFNAPGE